MKRIAMACVLAAVTATGALAEGKTHYLAVHVDESDRQTLNMALNNVQNVIAHYEELGDEVIVEVVAYGPGLQMYIEGESPVAERVKAMALASDNLTFAACENTLRKMIEKAGHDITLLDEATVVPSGVVRLVELQEQGYAYVRP